MDTTDDREEIQREEIPFSQDDKDSDDDAGDEYSYFCTTMQLSSSEQTAEHLRRTQRAGGTTEDIELENIQGNEDKKQNIEVLEEKPWRRAGADIADYFNYGFDEKSWNAYSRKQAELRRVKIKLKAKNKKRHARYGEEGTSCAYSSSGRASIPALRLKVFVFSDLEQRDIKQLQALPYCVVIKYCLSYYLINRESDPTDDFIGGQPESSRQERHQCLNDGGSNTQVFCEDNDKNNSHQLPPPGNLNHLFELIPPTSLFYHLGPKPPSPTTTLVSGNSKGFGWPATSLSPCSSRRVTVTPGVIDATKAWECCILREKHNKDRDRSRGDGHDKISKRRRYGEENCSSSRCSKEEQMKHRDVGKRGHQHRRFERGSREKRQSDKVEGSRGTLGSSSRRSREVAGNRENRRKHRKSKRSRKEEKSRMFSADQERKLKFH